MPLHYSAQARSKTCNVRLCKVKKSASPTRLRLCSVGLATYVSGTCYYALEPARLKRKLRSYSFYILLSELDRERLGNFSSPSLPSPARSLWEVKRMGVAAAGPAAAALQILRVM